MKSVTGRVAVLITALLSLSPAFAYIGPGTGLSAIGSVLALVGALLLMIVGFVWYPLKRLFKRKDPEPQMAGAGTEVSEPDDSQRKDDIQPEES